MLSGAAAAAIHFFVVRWQVSGPSVPRSPLPVALCSQHHTHTMYETRHVGRYTRYIRNHLKGARGGAPDLAVFNTFFAADVCTVRHLRDGGTQASHGRQWKEEEKGQGDGWVGVGREPSLPFSLSFPPSCSWGPLIDRLRNQKKPQSHATQGNDDKERREKSNSTPHACVRPAVAFRCRVLPCQYVSCASCLVFPSPCG